MKNSGSVSEVTNIWLLTNRSGGGYYRIVNRNSGKVVEVVGSSTADGAAVEQNTWNGGENQQYLLESLGTAAAASKTSIATGKIDQTYGAEKEMLSVQNPVSGASTVYMSLEQDGLANLTLFDLAGRPVSVLVNTYLPKGKHNIPFYRRELTAGMYILTLSQNGKKVSRQLIKL